MATINDQFTAVGILAISNVAKRCLDRAEISSSPFSCIDDPLRTTFRMKLRFDMAEDGKCVVAIHVSALSRCVKLLKPFLAIDVYDGKWKKIWGLKKENSYPAKKLESLSSSRIRFTAPKTGGFLRFVCDVNYAHDDQAMNNLSAEKSSIPSNPLNLGRALSSLLASGEDADFTLNIGEVAIKCHKVVLMARSSYFRSLFRSGMRECQVNMVAMEGDSPALFRNLLRFLYSGRLPRNMPAIAEDLLPLAEMYALNDLKAACVDTIRSSVTVENVIRTIVLADLHQCPELFRHCLPLFKENAEYLKTKEEWQLIRDVPNLMERLFLCAASDSGEKTLDLRPLDDDKLCLQHRHSMRLSTDMAQMLDAKDPSPDQSSCTDITLTLEDGKSIQAHRCILRARSPFLRSALASLLVNDYKLDGSPVVVKELVKFLYSGAAPENLESIAIELLPLAKKYRIDDLFLMCERALRRILSLDNLVDILILSQVYDLPLLFKYCLPFYQANSMRLNPQSEEKLEGHPKLLLKLAKGFAVQCDNCSLF